MRSSLLSSLAVLAGLSALPACTVNYYVPAATDAPTASAPPQRMPPRGRWQPAPGPRTSAPQYYPPVAQAPQPQPVPQPGPPRPTPPPRQTPPPLSGPVKQPPIRQNPPTPAPPAPTSTPPVRIVRPVRPVKTTPTPAPPTPAPPMPAPPTPAPPTPAPPTPAPPTPAPPAPAPELPVPPAPAPPSTPPVLTTIPSSLPQDEAPIPPQNTVVSPVIVFGRTPCLGKCPHFIATIFADGRVQYEGFRYAPVEGQREAKLSPETVRSLLQAADKAGFRQLPNTFGSGASDMPSTGLTITYPDGTTKSVRAEDNVPAELQSLFTRINAEIEHALGMAGDR